MKNTIAMNNTTANVTYNPTKWIIKAVDCVETIISKQAFPNEQSLLRKLQEYLLTDSDTGVKSTHIPQVLDITVQDSIDYLMELYEDDGYGWSDFSDELIDLLYRLNDSCEINGGAQ